MFQISLKDILNIFLELAAGQVRQNCRATLVIPPRTSVATIVTICCNHRDGEYFLHRITRKLGSTVTSTVIIRLLPLTNYISGAKKWNTMGFVTAHQRKYWNAFTVGRDHADDGCSCNHRAVPPSAIYITKVSVATYRQSEICEYYAFNCHLDGAKLLEFCRRLLFHILIHISLRPVLMYPIETELRIDTKLVTRCYLIQWQPSSLTHILSSL